MPLNDYNGNYKYTDYSEDAVASRDKNPIEHANQQSYEANKEDDFYNSILGQWLFPGVQQEKEFAQQVAFQREQNEWNSERARMERAKEAGINPVTAGQQIVGGASPSVGSPNSTSSAGTIGELPNAVFSGVNSVVDAVHKAYENRKLDEETKIIAPNATLMRMLMNAQVFKEFSLANFNNAEAIGLQIENRTRGESCQLDIAAKRLNLRNIRAQIREHNATVRQKIADAKLSLQKIEESKASMSLMEYQKAVMTAQALLDAILADDHQWNLDFKQKHGYDPTWPTHSIMWSVAADDSLTDEEAEAKFDFMLEKLYMTNFYEHSAKGFIQMLIDDNKTYDEYLRDAGLIKDKAESDVSTSYRRKGKKAVRTPILSIEDSE